MYSTNISRSEELYIERVKYLFGTSFNDLSLEDRMNLISVKIVLEPKDYQLLRRWHMDKWKFENLSKELRKSNAEMKTEILKILIDLEFFMWSYESSPFRKDTDKKRAEKYISPGDMVIKHFLDSDSVIISTEEYNSLLSE